MSIWVFALVILATGLLVARRWLPDRASLADTAYDCYRALVPAPRPTVRVVTKRIARVCRRQRVVMPFGAKAVLPRAFLVGVSPDEYAVVEPLLDTMHEAVSASLLRTAREKQWLHDGPPSVLVQSSETVAEGRPEVISTTLPSPRTAHAHVEAPVNPREPTVTLDSAPIAAEPPRTLDEPTQATPEPTQATPEPTRTAPPALVAVAGGRVDLLPEPTAAEIGPPAGEHRLRASDGEPDIVVGHTAIVVGRAADCDVTVQYASASRRHLRVIPTPAGCRLEDLGSRHGTRVNGAAVRHPVLLRARDTVQIGAMGPCWTYLPPYRAAVTPPLREVQ